MNTNTSKHVVVMGILSFLLLSVCYAQSTDNPLYHHIIGLFGDGGEVLWSVHLFEAGQDGSFMSYSNYTKILEEGTYEITQDTISFHIAESSVTERVGMDICVTWWADLSGFSYYFTNTQVLTAGIATTDTTKLSEVPITGVESGVTWKSVKELFE